MQPAPLAVFDLDGTLVDAFEDIRAALNHALGRVGLPPYGLEAVRGFVGNGISMLVERALGPDNQQHHAEVLAATRAYYAEHPVDHAEVYPGMREVLVELRKAGWRTAILSNKVDSLVDQIAKLLDLSSLLDVSRGERPGIAIKPDPAPLIALAEELHATRVAVIGDGMPDAELAQRTGATFIGVSWGIVDEHHLGTFGPVVKSPAQILDILLG